VFTDISKRKLQIVVKPAFFCVGQFLRNYVMLDLEFGLHIGPVQSKINFFQQI